MGDHFDGADVHAAATAFRATADIRAAAAADTTRLPGGDGFASGVSLTHTVEATSAPYGAWVANFQAAQQMAQSLPVSTATPLGGHARWLRPGAEQQATPQLLLRVRPPTDGTLEAGVKGQLRLTTVAMASRHAPRFGPKPRQKLTGPTAANACALGPQPWDPGWGGLATQSRREEAVQGLDRRVQGQRLEMSRNSLGRFAKLKTNIPDELRDRPWRSPPKSWEDFQEFKQAQQQERQEAARRGRAGRKGGGRENVEPWEVGGHGGGEEEDAAEEEWVEWTEEESGGWGGEDGLHDEDGEDDGGGQVNKRPPLYMCPVVRFVASFHDLSELVHRGALCIELVGPAFQVECRRVGVADGPRGRTEAEWQWYESAAVASRALSIPLEEVGRALHYSSIPDRKTADAHGDRASDGGEWGDVYQFRYRLTRALEPQVFEFRPKKSAGVHGMHMKSSARNQGAAIEDVGGRAWFGGAAAGTVLHTGQEMMPDKAARRPVECRPAGSRGAWHWHESQLAAARALSIPSNDISRALRAAAPTSSSSESKSSRKIDADSVAGYQFRYSERPAGPAPRPKSYRLKPGSGAGGGGGGGRRAASSRIDAGGKPKAAGLAAEEEAGWEGSGVVGDDGPAAAQPLAAELAAAREAAAAMEEQTSAAEAQLEAATLRNTLAAAVADHQRLEEQLAMLRGNRQELLGPATPADLRRSTDPAQIRAMGGAAPGGGGASRGRLGSAREADTGWRLAVGPEIEPFRSDQTRLAQVAARAGGKTVLRRTPSEGVGVRGDGAEGDMAAGVGAGVFTPSNSRTSGPTGALQSH